VPRTCRHFGISRKTFYIGGNAITSTVMLDWPTGPGCLSHLTARGDGSTYFRATLVYVADNQNITLSLPRELLRRVKRVAADRDTSVSALMTEALDRLADEDRRYSAARKRALAALRSRRSLGTQGRRTWSRDELHER
jgi:Ribbon-helix-helix protein, copG family